MRLVMTFIKPLLTLSSLLLSVCVIATCVLGDHLLSLPAVTRSIYLSAVSDAATHSLVGCCCWAVITDHLFSVSSLLEVLLCGLHAGAVDIDRFIQAKSFSLKEARSLGHRPFLHCSTIIPAVVATLLVFRVYLYRLLQLKLVWHLPWISFIALASHHLRDATRRGLWFAPLGSTWPLSPSWVYMSAILCLAHLLKVIVELDKEPREPHSDQDAFMLNV